VLTREDDDEQAPLPFFPLLLPIKRSCSPQRCWKPQKCNKEMKDYNFHEINPCNCNCRTKKSLISHTNTTTPSQICAFVAQKRKPYFCPSF
jgi:hypothetical protein